MHADELIGHLAPKPDVYEQLAKEAEMRRLAVCLLIFVASYSVAIAADQWTCTYPGFDPDHSPVLLRIRENHGVFVEEEFGMEFKILRDDEYSVIAVWTFSGVEHGRPSIASTTIMINKATGEFLRANAILTEPDTANARVRGKCLKD